MKPVVIFFLCLCFHLLGVYDAHASTHSYKEGYSPATHIEKEQWAGDAISNQHNTIANNAGISQEQNLLISVEDDDEDFARKFGLLARCFIALSYAFILSCLCNCLKQQLPFCKHLSLTGSDKYIVQRVLRL